MNRHRHRQPWKISTILYLLVFGAVVLPIALISATILREYRHDLLQQTSTRTLQTLRSVAYSEEQEIAKAVTYSAAVAMDKEVLRYASELRQLSGQERQAAFSRLTGALDKYGLSMSGHVQSVNFFFRDGGMFSYMKDLAVSEAEVRQQPWYGSVLQQQDRVRFLGMQSGMLYDSGSEYTAAAAISPSSFQSLHDIDLIYFVFDQDAFEEVLRQNPYSRTSGYRLATEGGQIIASSGAAPGGELPASIQSRTAGAAEGSFVQSTDSGRALIAFATVETTGWKAVYEIPYAEITATYSQMFRFVLLATLLTIAFFLLISFILVHKVSRPIRLLVMKMSRVTQGYLGAKADAAGSRETILLGHAFNHMMDQINLLIRQREQEVEAKRKAEFAALQSQINPHFMINTLNSIRLMALISKQETIRKMTHALIRLLSSSFNRGSSLTLMREEIENLKQYLFIMKTRYGEQFEVQWQIHPAVLDCSILKLLLQPILENSIVHGLSQRKSGGLISISASVDGGRLTVTVADNGTGISPEQAEELGLGPDAPQSRHEEGQEIETFSGMGIRNVHRRIQLHYGPEYGLSIAPNEWGGATVIVRTPAMTGTPAQMAPNQEDGGEPGETA